MNDLAVALIWLSVQVTAVALAGLGLSAAAARRAPAAGASAALTAHAATVVLAVLACCPLPAWWAWQATLPAADPAAVTDPASVAVKESSAAEQSASSAGGVPVAALLPLLKSLGRRAPNTNSPTVAPEGWPTIAITVVGAGTALGLCRLLLGLWAVRRGYRRSRPVEHGGLLRLVSELRSALGVRRRTPGPSSSTARPPSRRRSRPRRARRSPQPRVRRRLGDSEPGSVRRRAG